jgi:hypothetical protein
VLYFPFSEVARNSPTSPDPTPTFRQVDDEPEHVVIDLPLDDDESDSTIIKHLEQIDPDAILPIDLDLDLDLDRSTTEVVVNSEHRAKERRGLRNFVAAYIATTAAVLISGAIFKRITIAEIKDLSIIFFSPVLPLLGLVVNDLFPGTKPKQK